MSRIAAKNLRLRHRLRGFRGVLCVVGLLSGLINILALTGSFYMLQVYDRVLTSHSVPTLVALSVMALMLFGFQGLLDVVRAQIMIRLAARVESKLLEPTYEAVLHAPIAGRTAAEAVSPLRDLDTVRNFISSPNLLTLFDVPWLPVYLVFLFALHAWLGWLTVFGAAVLIGITFLSEYLVNARAKEHSDLTQQRRMMVEAHARNAEVIRAHGLQARAFAKFAEINDRYREPSQMIGDRMAAVSGTSKIVRAALQSALLGLGAYLALRNEISAGAIIAASIAASRSLAPIEQAIASWRVFASARQCYARLEHVILALPSIEKPLELPAPHNDLLVEGISVAIPNTPHLIVKDVSFALKAGQALAIIGPSAAGKSTLARAIAGVWPVVRGAIRLDGAKLDRYSNTTRGASLGYMPQEVDLLAGDVTETISRIEAKPDADDVIAAAKAANVHELILRLPQAYNTQIGDRGTALSAGQRQRIGLARALYKEPFVVVLDEPNSNLDIEGEAALAQAIKGVRERGGIVILVAHRPGLLAVVDTIAIMRDGQIVDFGPRDTILAKGRRGPTAASSLG